MRTLALICSGLILGIVPPLPSPPETGTSIIAVRTPDVAYIGADSRILQGPTRQFTGCKIEQIRGMFVTHAGIFSDPSTGWDLREDSKASVEKGGTIREIADRFAARTQRALTTAVTRLKVVDPAYFRRYCEGKHSPAVLFAGLENGIPVIAAHSFFIETRKGQVVVTPDPAVDCPGDCPTGMTDLPLGNHDASDKIYAATPHFWRVNGFIPGIDKLITSEIAANPDEVGPPISILRIDKSGAHWEEGHQGLCPDIMH